MSWYNESRRHSLSARGIKTTVDNKPVMRVPHKERYYEDEDGILRGRCAVHGEYVGDAIGCPQCFAESEENDALAMDMRDCPDCASMRMQGLTPACCQYHLDEQQRIYDRRKKSNSDKICPNCKKKYFYSGTDNLCLSCDIDRNLQQVNKEKDSDGDGVPDRLDCDPEDPDKQGFFDVLKARVLQTRAVESMNDANHDLRVANLRKEIEKREEELEAKKEAKLIKLSQETERKLYAQQLNEKERELDLLQDELEADTFKGRFKRGLRVIGSQAGILAKKGAKRVGQELFSDKPVKTYQKVSLTKEEKAMTSPERLEAIRKKKKELAIIKSKKEVDTLTAKEKKLQEEIKLLQSRKR